MKMMDDYDDEESSDYGDDFSSAVQEAFPKEDWDEDRLAALKEAIRLCVEKDEEPSKKPGSLALIFGMKPKKKG
jgi:hypothetical protein